MQFITLQAWRIRIFRREIVDGKNDQMRKQFAHKKINKILQRIKKIIKTKNPNINHALVDDKNTLRMTYDLRFSQNTFLTSFCKYLCRYYDRMMVYAKSTVLFSFSNILNRQFHKCLQVYERLVFFNNNNDTYFTFEWNSSSL